MPPVRPAALLRSRHPPDQRRQGRQCSRQTRPRSVVRPVPRRCGSPPPACPEHQTTPHNHPPATGGWHSSTRQAPSSPLASARAAAATRSFSRPWRARRRASRLAQGRSVSGRAACRGLCGSRYYIRQHGIKCLRTVSCHCRNGSPERRNRQARHTDHMTDRGNRDAWQMQHCRWR